jgi:S-DNA-T family DNA segregation ATPase FtsK/SpoIIIE
MADTARTDERRTALRFGLVALGWLLCLFAWAAVLSFSIADPPSTTVWPTNDPPRNWCGDLGAWLAFHAFHYLGLGVYPLVFLAHAAVIAAGQRGRLNDLWLRFLGTALTCTSAATAGTLVFESSDRFLISGPGGVLGAAMKTLLLTHCDYLGTVLLLALAGLVGLLLAADNVFVGLFRWLRWARQPSERAAAHGEAACASPAATASGPALSRPTRPWRPADSEARAPAPRAAAPRPRPPVVEEEADEADELPLVAAGPLAVASAPATTVEPPHNKAIPIGPMPLLAETRIETKPAPKPAKAPPPPPPRAADGDYQLPPLDLLDRSIPIDKTALENLCREKAFILEQTLNEFRLAVEVVAIETGPVITVFELKLAPGIKVSQIASLSNDMARALKAPAVRVVAPLPGKSTIGIEVPNIDKEKVRLRDVMEMSASRYEHFALPLFLGKDASGQPLIADLTRMPHLLIAGTTGSGKSVCITSLIMSILMTRSADEVNLILVDPKVVELAMYKDVPHLMCPIVTEVAKAEGILDWASTKMDERYELLAEAGVKDIRSYNRLGYAGLRERLQATDEEMAAVTVRLPYIIIMIDELADLMMTSGKEVEFYLCRIAQKSRAVGIHLIVSTQRPQANVVTGLIKSNLPSRIAFRVSSRLDSRIVLDQNGGEVLMGQGDLLFLPPGSSKLIRAQGTFVDDDELRRVVKHCRTQREPQFHPELVRLPGAGDAASSERDELFDQAVDIVLETNRGSVSLLQRRLTIGYGRASRLIDQMCAAGLVGEYKGSQAREVLVTPDEWLAMKGQRDREESEEAARASEAAPP